MKIAVLFDGAGLARLGLEQAGHECTGFELNPIAHHLGQFVGSGRCVLADVRDVNLSAFDAVWASSPCQKRSSARTQGDAQGEFCEDLLDWSLGLQVLWPNLKTLWVENVCGNAYGKMADWGRAYNAYQFGVPQNRNRMIGGFYSLPDVLRSWAKDFPGVCPTITASEYKGCATDDRRASRFYGRRLTLQEVAHHQGFEIPAQWFDPLPGFRMAGPQSSWSVELYRAIGNGVPVQMARAFGKAAAEGRVAVPAWSTDQLALAV
jgi:site-specific DNA-cytosine methylase